MKLLIVSHVKFFYVNNRYYSRGGSPLEYNILNEIFDTTHILVHTQKVKSLPSGYQSISNKIWVHRIGRRMYSRPIIAIPMMGKVILQTASIIRKFGIDLVYGKAPGEIGMAGVLGANFSRTPCILRLGGDWLSDHKLKGKPRFIKKYRQRMLRLISQKSNYILPVSKEIRDKTISLGVDSKKILQPLYSPALTEDFFKVPIIPTRDIKEFVFIGNLGSVKNIEGLLRGFKILVDEINCNSKIRLKIVGDGPLRGKLERLVSQLDLSNKVNFIGRVPHDEVARHLINSWALVHPSFTEGAPKAVIEAMAAARPVIASNVGEIPYLVKDGVTGYIVDPHNVNDIAEKLHLLLSDDLNAIQMGKAGREIARKWELGTFRERILDLANNIVN